MKSLNFIKQPELVPSAISAFKMAGFSVRYFERGDDHGDEVENIPKLRRILIHLTSS